MTAVAEVDPETQAKHARLKVLQDELAAASLRLVKAVNPVLQVRAGCFMWALFVSVGLELLSPSPSARRADVPMALCASST